MATERAYWECSTLISEIRERFISRFYTRATIAFDGAEAFKDSFGSGILAPDLLKAFPENMREQVSGRTLPSFDKGYGYGFPDILWE